MSYLGDIAVKGAIGGVQGATSTSPRGGNIGTNDEYFPIPQREAGAGDWIDPQPAIDIWNLDRDTKPLPPVKPGPPILLNGKPLPERSR